MFNVDLAKPTDELTNQMLSNKSVILTKGPDVGRFVVVNLG